MSRFLTAYARLADMQSPRLQPGGRLEEAGGARDLEPLAPTELTPRVKRDLRLALSALLAKKASA